MSRRFIIVWIHLVLCVLMLPTPASAQTPVQTPQPYPELSIDTIAYNNHSDNFSINLIITNQGFVPQLRVKIEDRNGRLIREYFQNNSPRFDLSSDQLIHGEEYILTVTVYSSAGMPQQFLIEQNYGGPIQTIVEAKRSFVYPAVEETIVEITTLSHNPTTNLLRLNLNTRNINTLTHYVIWLENQATNQIITHQMRFPISSNNNAIEIPLDPKLNPDLVTGRYLVVLEGQDNNNAVILRTSYDTSLTFPKETIWSRLRQNSTALAIIGGVVFLLLIIVIKELILPRRNQAEFIKPPKPQQGNLLSIEDETLARLPQNIQIKALLTLVENKSGASINQAPISITKKFFMIGRNQGNSFNFNKVSSKHALIFQDHDGKFYIQDQESRNRTYLNGNHLTPLAKYQLKNGDRIGITQYLVFEFISKDQ